MKNIVPLFLSVVLLPAVSLAGPLTFSIDPGSPAPFSPADILVPGPGLAISEAALGLTPGDNLNALSFGNDPVQGPALTGGVEFSVDRLSAGLPGTAVDIQSFPFPEAHGDVFSTIPTVPGPGTNMLSIDEEMLGLTPGGFFGDDLDALDRNGGPGVYFSVDFLSPANLGGGVANDIFVGTTGTLFADGDAFGLDFDDDLDALILQDRGTIGVLDPGLDTAYFSLTSDSPTTFTASGDPYVPVPHGTPIVPGGVSAADILFTDFLGPITLAASADSIGLSEFDELNALANPEPGTLALVGVGVAGFFCVRRRKQKRIAQAG